MTIGERIRFAGDPMDLALGLAPITLERVPSAARGTGLLGDAR